MTRIVSIVGMERCDIVFYFSEICRAMRLHVLVIDNTFSKDLFYALGVKDEEVIERGFAVYTKNLDYGSDEAFEEFDLIIFYEGLNPSEDNLLKSDVIFVFSDYSETGIRQVKESIDWKKGKKIYCILRDKISKKISDKLAFSMLEINNAILAGSMAFSNKDYCRYISFSHNRLQSVKGISEDMKEALIFMANEVVGADRKTALKIIKKI